MIVHIILVTGERVDIGYLSLLKYQIHEQIVPEWRELAKQLGSGSTLIEIWSESRPQQATDAMMYEWLRRDPGNCWRKLVQKMKDAKLLTAAADLAHDLHHMTAQ